MRVRNRVSYPIFLLVAKLSAETRFLGIPGTGQKPGFLTDLSVSNKGYCRNPVSIWYFSRLFDATTCGLYPGSSSF